MKLTYESIQNRSPEFKRRNPHLYGAVGAVETHQSQPTPAQTLDRRNAKQPRVRCGPAAIFTLIARTRNPLDEDNIQGAFKHLRDEIAKAVGVDDGDNRIQWKYEQQRTSETEGVVLHIEA